LVVPDVAVGPGAPDGEADGDAVEHAVASTTVKTAMSHQFLLVVKSILLEIACQKS
jgi:hypothetical protein